ncbi:hypothetical protein H4R34_000917, partial [Dimargaris verticillata]
MAACNPSQLLPTKNLALESSTQLAYFKGDTSEPLMTGTVGQQLGQVCQDHPDNLALVFCEEDISWSFQQLNSKVSGLAANLYDLGIRPGDRVGVFMSNYSPVCLLQLAAARLGAIMVQFHISFLVHELEYTLALTECKILVVQPSYRATDCIQMLVQLIPELQTCKANALQSSRFPLLASVLVADCSTMGAAGYHRLCPTNWRRMAGLTCFQTFASGRVNPATIEAIQQFNVKSIDPISILFTSGSTGQPKPVTLSHFSVLNSGYFNHRRMGMTNQDIACLSVPLYHCMGLVGGLFTLLTSGSARVIPSSIHISEATLKALQTYRCTYYFGVGTMFADLLAHPNFDEFDLSSLARGVIGGSNCPASVKAEFIQRLGLTSLISNYGMTETTYAAIMMPLGAAWEQMVQAEGQCLPYFEARIINSDTGKLAAVGEHGEVHLRSEYTMQYYWNEPEKTRQTKDSDDWIHTGDIAKFDSNGFCYVVGRKKDMIIKGGENIFPGEIEKCLISHPNIRGVAVIGVQQSAIEEE